MNLSSLLSLRNYEPRTSTSTGSLKSGKSYLIIADAVYSVNLPVAGGDVIGSSIRFAFDDQVSGNNVTISGNGKNISGSATLVVSSNYAQFDLVWNGTQWLGTASS